MDDGSAAIPPFSSSMQVRSDHDTRNFEDYPDSDGDSAKPLAPKEQSLFADLDEF